MHPWKRLRVPNDLGATVVACGVVLSVLITTKVCHTRDENEGKRVAAAV
jgi:hypothetical protein